MFEYLNGVVEYKKTDYVAIDINGVGYKVYISLREYEKLEIGKQYRLYIYNHIKEDTNKLIGFLEERERKIFEMLLAVNGIGISLALAVLSNFSYDKIIEIISNEDYNSLKRVPKLGEKKAQLIILELKNKLKNIEIISSSHEIKGISMDMLQDLISALESLGYNKKEIDKNLAKIDLKEYASVEEAIKGILKNIRIGE